MRTIGVESLFCEACFLFIVVHNYVNLLGWLLGRQRLANVPLVGGLIGAIGISLQDVVPVTYFWLPIVLDPTLFLLASAALKRRFDHVV